MVTGFIRGQRLVLCSPPIAAGTYETIPARFVFETCGWDGMERFVHLKPKDGGEERILPIGGDGAVLGHLNLSAGEWVVWIHGDAVSEEAVTARLTTATAPLFVSETGAEDPLPLPPTYGEQVLALVTTLKEEAAALVRERTGVLVNRADGSLIPVWAGSEEAYEEARRAGLPESGTICLVDIL
ncbi:MAG: hypothetical protein E7576_10865 [Ruminococcaceae bacterium]|nr:hypothetical protein [Oscillospiraceae bacterium]